MWSLRGSKLYRHVFVMCNMDVTLAGSTIITLVESCSYWHWLEVPAWSRINLRSDEGPVAGYLAVIWVSWQVPLHEGDRDSLVAPTWSPYQVSFTVSGVTKVLRFGCFFVYLIGDFVKWLDNHGLRLLVILMCSHLSGLKTFCQDLSYA